MLAAVGLVAILGQANSTMTAYVMWSSAALAIFDRHDRAEALRWITATVYLFAAPNKLFSEFRSGDILYRNVPGSTCLTWGRSPWSFSLSNLRSQ